MEEIASSRTFYNNLRSHDESKLESTLEVIDDKKFRSVIRRAINGKTSNWLTVIQISKYHFDLSPIEFRDGLAF